MKILRAIIYARVSKDDSGRGRSPKEQIKSCTADCEFEGWPIGAILQDNDRGATRYSKREREDFAKLPKILRAGDVLVVWEPSRITREMGEFSTFCDMLADRGVLLYYDGRLWDMRDDDDRNRVWQDILDGVKSATKTRKRVLRAMNDNLEDRKPHGKRAPGYDILRDPRTGRTMGRAVNPKQRRILQACADEVVELGNTVNLTKLSKQYAARWTAAGGGGAFKSADIKRILTNPTTYGMRHHDNQIVGPGTWDPVLDPELMRQIRDILCDPTRLTHRGSEPRWLLSNTALCGVCLTKNIEATVQARANPRKRSGEEPRAPEYQHLGHITRNIERVDDHVEQLLMILVEQPGAAEMLHAPERADEETIRRDVATIDQLRKEKRDYIRDAARTRMSAEDVAVYTEVVDSQIREIEDRLATLRDVPSSGLRELAAADDPRMVWEYDLQIEDKRAIIRSCMRVIINPIGRVGRPKAGVEPPIGVEIRPIGELLKLSRS